jgi:tetratricopeptide (TPR) repeat protein
LEKPRAGEKTTKERIHRLKSVLESDPASVAFFPLSKVLYSAGAVDEAVGVLERGLSYHPEFVTARLDLAHIYHQIGHDDNAISQLEKIVSLDLYNVEALKELVVILLEQGFKKEALRHLNRLQELDPENDLYQEWMEQATGEEPAEKVMVAAETPHPPTTREFNTLTMVDIYMEQGLWKKAGEVCKAIIARNPDNQEAQQKLAEINAELEKIEQGEPEEDKPSKTSWEAAETVPLAASGAEEKDTADLLLDKWEEFRDLIATAGASGQKPPVSEAPIKPLISDEELERFAASIANITQEQGVATKPHEEEMDWEGIVTAEETPATTLESGYEEMTMEYAEEQPPAEKPEPTTDESSLPRIEDFAPPVVTFPAETVESAAPVSIPIVEEEERLEELTSPELLPSPVLQDIAAQEPIPPLEEAPAWEEEIPAPKPIAPAEAAETTAATSVPAVKEEIQLEELTAPETIPTTEIEELIAATPIPTTEELPELEELPTPELIVAPEMADLSEQPSAPAAEEITHLDELTAPEAMPTPSLAEMEEVTPAPPPPLQETVPSEVTPMLEELPNLDEFIRPPEPPKTDKLESIDDLLSAPTEPIQATQPPVLTPPEDFPEFEDWLDKLRDQNA